MMLKKGEQFQEKYQILGLIESGAFSDVYKAYSIDKKKGHSVIIAIVVGLISPGRKDLKKTKSLQI